MPVPHYLTTSRGQLGAQTAGDGPPVIVIGGLARSATLVVDELAAALADRQIIAIEPPGVGGSARIAVGSVERTADILAEALSHLDLTSFDLLAYDLSAAVVPALLDRLERRPRHTVLVDLDRATGWVETGITIPDLSSQDAGTHLNDLWVFLRDRQILRPDAPHLPASSGPALPTNDELSSTFVAAVEAPENFARCWQLFSSQLLAAAQAAGVTTAGRQEVPSVLDGAISGGSCSLPATEPAPGTEIWHQYLPTKSGLAHLRRAGASGRPIIVLPTGGGSSAQFAPVISGLADSGRVVAIDYFGNGLSEKTERDVTIAGLAAEVLDVIDALGYDEVDVFASHTGSCVAIELSILAPDRLGKMVLEAPVMVTPEFRARLLAEYFPDLVPDKFGQHLQRLWHWRRDMFLYWPWFDVDWRATRGLGLPNAEDLQLYAVGILESGPSFGGAYRAGFVYDALSRLPLLKTPSILTSGPNDMLANSLDDAAESVPGGLLRIQPTPCTMWWPDPDPQEAKDTLQVYRDFLLN